MNLKELLKQIVELNKLNDKLELGNKYYLVVSTKYGVSHNIHNTNDLKDLYNFYTKETGEKLVSAPLSKEERYLYTVNIPYKVLNTEYVETYNIHIAKEVE